MLHSAQVLDSRRGCLAIMGEQVGVTWSTKLWLNVCRGYFIQHLERKYILFAPTLYKVILNWSNVSKITRNHHSVLKCRECSIISTAGRTDGVVVEWSCPWSENKPLSCRSLALLSSNSGFNNPVLERLFDTFEKKKKFQNQFLHLGFIWVKSQKFRCGRFMIVSK